MKRELYHIIDSFLTEAKDQNGNERSLDRLNKDRHLCVERLEALIEDSYANGYADGMNAGKEDKKLKSNMPFKDTQEGTTHYCKRCELEALMKEHPEHSCGTFDPLKLVEHEEEKTPEQVWKERGITDEQLSKCIKELKKQNQHNDSSSFIGHCGKHNIVHMFPADEDCYSTIHEKTNN